MGRILFGPALALVLALLHILRQWLKAKYGTHKPVPRIGSDSQDPDYVLTDVGLWTKDGFEAVKPDLPRHPDNPTDMAPYIPF